MVPLQKALVYQINIQLWIIANFPDFHFDDLQTTQLKALRIISNTELHQLMFKQPTSTNNV